jgi:ABC-type multidrug transport system fused ATPase/permease subunit
MKAIKLTLFLAILASFFPMTTYASTAVVSTPEVRQSMMQKLMDKKEQLVTNLETKDSKFAKKLAKMERRFEKFASKGVDFKDPIKKWMWFWIFGWAAALVLFIVAVAVAAAAVTTTTGVSAGFGAAGIIYLLGYLCGLFGSVSLIIWLVKMNS